MVTESEMLEHMREQCVISEAQQLDPTGHAVRVTVIRGGKSLNGYFYSEEMLQTIARLIEWAHAYADHGDATQATRSLRDMVGFYSDAAYIAPVAGEVYGRVDATLHILASADWLWLLVREACQLGRSNLVGLSIDIFGHWQQDKIHNAKVVTRILALNSCDIVTRPSAGGSIQRILHGDVPLPHGEEDVCAEGSRSIMSETSDTPQQYESVSNDQSPLSGSNAAGQNLSAPVASVGMADRAVGTGLTLSAVPTGVELINEQQNQLQAVQHLRQQLEEQVTEVRLQRSQLLLEQCLQESVLPQAVRDEIRARYSGRIFEEGQLQQDVERALQMMARLTRDGLVRGHGYDKADVSTQITEAEKIQAAFDLMMGLEIDSARMGNIRAFTSILEAYMRVTGESTLMAGISSATQLGNIRVSESAPIARISEADVTTASFSYLLGTSMNKRLLKDYQTWPAEWMKFVTIAPIRDFKQQVRVRLGAFGSLPIVAEDTPYTSVTLTDSSAVYVPQKRGNLVTISRETIINDDLHAIRQVPTKLAAAAAYTLAEFVYGFLSNNPTIYDGSALFTTGVPHSNLGSASLSSVAMQSGITAMREQTNYAGKRIGLRPRYLVVPPELEWQAMVVTKSAGLPGSNNNDINPMLGYVTPIVAPQLTSATQWFLVGDPREIDTVEIGFVGGQVNPMLFVQDQALFGLNFVQDAITYKVRQEYGGAVVDYRGLYRGL
jgi:hypothetical protein